MIAVNSFSNQSTVVGTSKFAGNDILFLTIKVGAFSVPLTAT